MSYTGSELAEYPVPIEDGLANDDSGDLAFLYRPKDAGVVPPPTPANSHVNEWSGNAQYGSSVHIHQRRLASVDCVDSAFRKGYIISAPGEMAFSDQNTDDDEDDDYTLPHPSSSFHSEGYLQRRLHPDVSGLDYPTFKLDLRWAVDIPDGYSVLIVDPFFTQNKEHSIVPKVHDSDGSFTWISVTLLIRDSAFRINYGTPIAQVIPFKRDSSRLPAVIDRSVPTEE
jgi:hypothetical protein